MRVGFVLLAALASIATAVSPSPVESVKGLLLTVEQTRDGAVHGDARVDRLVALFVPEGTPVTPFMEPGPFRATWRGRLEIRFRDRYRFDFEGTGTLALSIDDKPVELGQPLRLSRGEHAIEVRYGSPATGAAVARLQWAGSDFGAEAIPPELLSHDPSDGALLRGQSLRRGRESMARLQCTKCHVPPQALVFEDHPMPELSFDAPLLTGVGARLRPGWMERWVLDPKKVRHDATMPRLLHGPAAAAEARDIATYLASLGAAPGSRSDGAPDPAAATRGGVLVAQLGCVGCHTLPDAVADPERVALRGVSEKWYPEALIAFLQQPAAHRAWIGMPDFGLDAAEARDLAAFLLARDGAARRDVAFEAGDAVRGHELVLTRGCAKCHFVGEVGRFRGPDWKKLRRDDHGCLAGDTAKRGAAPDFGFDDGARADLRAAMPEWAALGRSTPAEFASRQVRALRCHACHARDGVEAQWTIHGEEVAELLADVEPPKLAQQRPALTWSGEKLRPEWTTALLRGEVVERPRPWLRARMPSFATGAEELAAGLAAQHGYGPATEGGDRTDPELVAIGKKLIGADGGFACTLCHALGKQPPIGVFEVQGIDLALTAERLREGYFHRWMSNPLRVDPASRMPRYGDDQGKTGFVDVLGGEARRQFEAMWQYLSTGRDLR